MINDGLELIPAKKKTPFEIVSYYRNTALRFSNNPKTYWVVYCGSDLACWALWMGALDGRGAKEADLCKQNDWGNTTFFAVNPRQ